MNVYNQTPGIKEIDFRNVKRGEKVFYEGLHTVVYVLKEKGGGAGMGEYPGSTTVVCDTGLVIQKNEWLSFGAVMQIPLKGNENE
jgi:hypothetical protein